VDVTDRPRLAGRVAIVTGAGHGIGRGIARVFARAGARLGVLDHDGAAAAAVAAEVGGLACVVDVTSREQVDAAVAAVLERFGRLDVVTQNVGIYPAASLDDLTVECWDAVASVNVRSLLHVVQACLPALRASDQGRITVTSSITGPRVGYPGFAAYGASKGAINGFIRSAALELAPYRITINAVEPGTVMIEGIHDRLAPGELARQTEAIPLKRLATAEEIGHAHLYLASPEAGYITGQSIILDGGQTLPESPAAVLPARPAGGVPPPAGT
jgi:3-oxoacyl-[acyl-carrier protein] reductase